MTFLHPGSDWKEQRRFALKHLRDFGLGKSSMEDIVRDEFEALADHMRTLADGGEVDTHLFFNLSIMNVLWRIVSGKRCDFPGKQGVSSLIWLLPSSDLTSLTTTKRRGCS